MTNRFIVVESPGPQGPVGDLSSALGIFDVTSYGAIGDGVTDDTAAIQAAIDAAVGGSVAAGAGAVRQALGSVYLPVGQYKVTNSLKIYSVSGFQMCGDGTSTQISMSGTTRAYVLDINGVAYSKFFDFTVNGLTSSDIVTTAAIGLNWDNTTSVNSTRSVHFENLVIRNLKYVHGLDLGGSSANRQVSEITVTQCKISGEDHDDATYWKTGIRCGSSTAGNILNHWITDTSVFFHQYNILANSTNVTATGIDCGHAEVDFRQTGGTNLSVKGVRSETSLRLYEEGGGATYSSSTQISNVIWSSDGMHADGKFIKFGYAGPKILENITISFTASAPKIDVDNGSGNSTQITAIGLRAPVAIASLFTVAGSPPVSIVSLNYTQDNPSDGTEDAIQSFWVKQFNNTGDLPLFIDGMYIGATDTNLYRNGTALLVTDGDFAVNTAGKGLKVKEGSNARMGTSTLVAGAVVVSNTSVTANTRIILTSQVDGGTPGFLRVSTRTASTSFTITSSSGTDTSTVAWMLVEPA